MYLHFAFIYSEFKTYNIIIYNKENVIFSACLIISRKLGTWATRDCNFVIKFPMQHIHGHKIDMTWTDAEIISYNETVL